MVCLDSCVTVLVLLLLLLVHVYTSTDLVLLLSCSATCTTLAVLSTGTPSTSWSYLVVCSGAAVVYIPGIVSVYDEDVPCQLVVSTLLSSVRHKLWATVLLTNILGLPCYWYAASKLEVSLTSMLSLHTSR